MAKAWKASQLSLASFKGAFNLQCRFDGAMVRLASGLIASVAPVVIMICCLALEIVDHGFGVAAALKASAWGIFQRNKLKVYLKNLSVCCKTRPGGMFKTFETPRS